MSSTQSLRNDHQLIEKMLKALRVTVELLKEGKKIPISVLDQTLDFTKNFTHACHHGKEEESLFPTLEKNGMQREGGPIARMIFEHEITRQLTEKIEISSKAYGDSENSEILVSDLQNYIDHVSSHLNKENLRLFVMADMLLKGKGEQVTKELDQVEESKLKQMSKTREHYEKLVQNVQEEIAHQT